ncbi:hypothetical protein BST61_g3157 [Cercospora zeina]
MDGGASFTDIRIQQQRMNGGRDTPGRSAEAKSGHHIPVIALRTRPVAFGHPTRSSAATPQQRHPLSLGAVFWLNDTRPYRPPIVLSALSLPRLTTILTFAMAVYDSS